MTGRRCASAKEKRKKDEWRRRQKINFLLKDAQQQYSAFIYSGLILTALRGFVLNIISSKRKKE
jgi:hypothetical protein